MLIDLLAGTTGSILVLILYTIGVLLVMGYSVGQFHLVYYYLKYRKDPARHPALPEVAPEDLPTVTVQIPMYNELHVAAQVIDACAGLDYPRHKLEIQVLDDSTDGTVGIVDERAVYWRAQGMDVTVFRRPTRTGYKAGALAEATPSAKGDVIAIFDADFRPQPDFLLRTAPYFVRPEVGMVQARWGHINRGYSLITRAQSLLHDAFFMVEQETRHRAGFFIRFNGSAGLWRKSAIADAGGWQHDTISEDFDLCLRAQLRGWKFLYVKDVEAPAELPVTVHDYKVQQYRWTKGRGQVIRKMLGPLWKADLPGMVKFHAVFDLLNVAIIPGIFIIALTSLWFIVALDRNPWMFTFAALFGISQINIVLVPFFSWVACSHYGKRFTGTLKEFLTTFPPFVFLLVGSTFMMCVALADGFRNRSSAVFHRTAKYNITRKTDTWRSKLYSPREVDPITWFEGALAVYFIGGIFTDIAFGSWGFLPFHISLSIGFTTVFFLSMTKS